MIIEFKSANIFIAAFRPGAIDTPGPGCLPELHKYTFYIDGILKSDNSGIGLIGPL